MRRVSDGDGNAIPVRGFQYRKELTVSLVHGYLNSTPDDFGHRWTNSYDGDNVECQYCGDSYNSKRWCTNRLVVSEQDREMDESMSRYYSQEAE